MKEISIVTCDGLKDCYLLDAVAGVWQKSGYRVVTGSAYSPNADVIVLHQNLTKLDPSSLPPTSIDVPVLNARVLDISKRVYSTLLLEPEDEWSGAVIIKSNLNHFGIPEKRMAPLDIMTVLRQQLAKLSWQHAKILPRRTYPILNSIKDVPDWVWKSDDLIVEKFMPERVDGLYCLRGWIFFGSRSYGYRLFSTEPMVKVGTMVRCEFFDKIPEELKIIRNKMGFDYGKFDYVEHDGQAILLDANKTPSYAGVKDTPRVRLLASGIGDFLIR